MTVSVHLYSQSQPITYQNVVNTYTKDGLYCVRLDAAMTHKFPLTHIFRIIEISQ